jgi:Uma2 family endonuclease
MIEKAHAWLAAGARLVWVIWPGARQVDVWRMGADEPPATLNAGDLLDGMDVLPGFSFAVADLFT